MNFIEQLQTRVDWNRVFGVVDSLYSDKGFTSNADNFARATMVEKALDKFSDIDRVDQNGYDFEWEDQKIELKMGKNLFYKRKDPNATKKFKVKSFLSETKTVEDAHARTLYQEGADGAMIELKHGDYIECNIGVVNPILPPINLSYLYQQADQQFLNF